VKAFFREHLPDHPEPLILCGFGRPELNNLCNENIATGPTRAGTVRLASGMTDEGTPGHWRVSAHSRNRQALYDRRSWPSIDADREASRRGESKDCATVPCVVPCQRGHLNLIDDEVLRD
jgi:hypothetical protein